MILIYIFSYLDEICQACIELSPIKMVPRPNYGSYKGIQSKHRKTHKGIKDQKSDSSESPLGNIRQKNMKELEYEEQSHIEHFGCPYFSPPTI